MNLNGLKALLSGVMLILTLCTGWLAIFIVNKIGSTRDPARRSLLKKIVGYLSCFAGGVFLATGLLHLWPEVTKRVQEMKIVLNIHSGYPFAEFLMVFGFLLVLSIEQIVVHLKEVPYTIVSPDSSTDLRENEMTDSTQSADFHKSHYRSIVLVLALSLHSIFEGLAIGLENDQGDVLQIYVAVIVHKLIITFSLGLSLAHSNLKTWTTIQAMFVFAIMSPLGTMIGLGIMNFESVLAASVINAILQAFASGTFMFVTFFEILPHEINVHNKDKLLKVAFLILGFSVICGLLFLDPDVQSD